MRENAGESRAPGGTAEMMNSDAILGQTYLSVANNISVMSEQRREYRTMTDLYDDWRAWNLARCNEYGLDLTIAE